MKTLRIIFAIGALFALVLLSTVAYASWESSALVDPHYFNTWEPSHAMAWNPANDEFVLAYGGDRLYVARGRDDQWTIEIVDETAGRGGGTSLFVEADGTVHVSYHDRAEGDLWYAVNDGSGWQTELVRDYLDSGDETSIVVDSAGAVYIAYKETTPADVDHIKLAENTGGTWVAWLVDGTDACGQSPSVDLDASGDPAVAYYCYFAFDDVAVKYSTFTGVNFSPETVDSGSNSVGADPALAFDGAGVPHIAYYKEGSVHYATKTKGWAAEKLETEAFTSGFANELAFINDIPTLMTKDFSNDRYLLFRKDVTWSYDPVAQCSGNCGDFAAAYDPTSEPNLAFLDSDPDYSDLKIAYDDGTKAWAEFELDHSSQAGKGGDLAIDGQGMPVATHIDTSGSIAATYWDGAAWATEEVAPWYFGFYFLGMAILPDGTPTVSYRSAANELGRAWYTGSAWQSEEIDVPVLVTFSTEIAVDGNGALHATYIDQNYELNYATNATGSWTTLVLNAGGTTWMQNALALDSQGKAHACWGDQTTDQLFHATNASGAWVLQPFAGVGGSHGPCEMAFDADDHLHLLYGNPDDLTLRLKYEDGTKALQERTIASDLYGFGGIGLAVDSAGGIHVSYFDDANDELVYGFAADDIAAFSFDTIDQTQPGYSFKSSLTLDAAGNPFISYQDTRFGWLLLAYNIEGPELLSIEPADGEQGATVSSEVTGTELFAVSEAYLDNGAETIACDNPANPDRETLDCEFDLTGATLGNYDLVVLTANGTDTLTGAFTVDEPTDDDDDDDDNDDADDDDDSGTSGDDDDDDDDGGCCGC
jgi:hypothetical protein